MPFATINGIRIHYLVQGKGPHLLMFAPGGWRSRFDSAMQAV